jgi:hypothetical protein
VTEKGNQKLTHAPETLAALTLNSKPAFMDTAKALAVKLLAKKS